MTKIPINIPATSGKIKFGITPSSNKSPSLSPSPSNGQLGGGRGYILEP
ncbi:hypothetical protein DDB_G0280323 [Dictyostelium discoideum AX4]|uniref:Uncharacterized protein DDB_G0280323 n=1 Tax=Dictyostelium discoideum TaxID=44689 RepID=Y3711_DICDI|nr:hypothetical protein DDB_G0280323 [Dictyostelium discoideum AX4]Q54VI0.2 RecName: Full=Uncharacterized protein DDB_G0280323 [Dictyostelium discoideum]EAL67388.2 hypothetical protein DDB_G0280323 [Dictyostelium discoideum AX4]|eukprot:XP_641375.2 hypothetical protein DDB_G0280323 [Dictyostelium discoideum AX4]